MPSIKTLDEYQQRAVGLRRNDTTEGWEQLNELIIGDEGTEVFTQHGDSFALLAPKGLWKPYQILIARPATRFGMAEEVGDVLWVAADSLARKETTLSSAVRTAMEKHSLDPTECETMEQLGAVALAGADRISVPTKDALTDSKFRGPKEISLADNPFSVYLRTVLRVMKSLNPDNVSEGQPTAIDFEAAQPLALSVGELVLATAYIFEARLKNTNCTGSRF
ncbi:hypothetical protein IPL68_00170 [Candidatus Saccharibacteria bacterium]|nr:MAG: hypothetical protein IPL68_00170 [Candidatus Saccharibacteria bacterium]